MGEIHLVNPKNCEFDISTIICNMLFSPLLTQMRIEAELQLEEHLLISETPKNWASTLLLSHTIGCFKLFLHPTPVSPPWYVRDILLKYSNASVHLSKHKGRL